MEKEPKLLFADEKEMLECMSEWKKKLGLSDWFIGAKICSKEDMSDEEWAGESYVQPENKCGTIKILRNEDIPKDCILKTSQECTLIHELLHFKMIRFEEKDYFEAIYNLGMHQLIEEMARALYAAKYGLDMEWFIADSAK